jgi:ABC-2 type transport system ATP-binding protein
MLGHPIGHKPTLGRIGYLPEHARFPNYLTGAQVLDYVGGLCGVPRSVVRKRSADLLERVEMSDWAGRKVSSYSKGMKQRIGIAQALVNDPEVVFLDEPTDGVDPGGRIRIRGIIEGLRDEGRTVFVNTHLLSEIEQVADRIAILSKGNIVREGRVSELMADRREYRIETAGPLPDRLAAQLRQDGMEVSGHAIALSADDPGPVQPVIDALRAERVVIRAVVEKSLTLEELFLEAVEDAEGGEGAA